MRVIDRQEDIMKVWYFKGFLWCTESEKKKGKPDFKTHVLILPKFKLWSWPPLMKINGRITRLFTDCLREAPWELDFRQLHSLNLVAFSISLYLRDTIFSSLVSLVILLSWSSSLFTVLMRLHFLLYKRNSW
jgi:hypothetical protein